MSKEITSKTKRLADILSLLENGPVKVLELADRFGVSIRTIQRDMGLFAQAHIPVVSPKQSIYAFAEGFSLKNAQLSAQQAALLAVSADIAHQIGDAFGPVQSQIACRFVPSSFENCVFGATKDDFAETDELAIMVLKCIKYRCILKVFLKDSKKNRTLYPRQMICLLGKWYVVSVNPGGEISYCDLENIGNYSLRGDEYTSTGYASFRPIPFIDWAIWQRAHQWVADLQTPIQEASNIPAEPISQETAAETNISQPDVKQENDL
ncbi:MAG: HTH domain-containing protein [Elusimicrobia bacterium]|nr:HTH domain-containing protein [Elusimicrobiota bacterium]